MVLVFIINDDLSLRTIIKPFVYLIIINTIYRLVAVYDRWPAPQAAAAERPVGFRCKYSVVSASGRLARREYRHATAAHLQRGRGILQSKRILGLNIFFSGFFFFYVYSLPCLTDQFVPSSDSFFFLFFLFLFRRSAGLNRNNTP